MGGEGAEVGNPVVVGAGEDVGDVGVFDEGEALGEPAGVEEGLIDAHEVHVEDAGTRAEDSGSEGVTLAGVEFADGLPSHAGLPDGVAGDVGVASVAEDVAVNLEIGIGLAFLAPEGVLGEGAVVAVDVAVPEVGGFDDMGVGVEDGEGFGGGH